MLDGKQRDLIDSWMRLASANGVDAYMRFMALWIAFNAYCYAQYAANANRERADLRNEQGLTAVTTEPQAVTGTIREIGGKVRIDIEQPGLIGITIAPKYTEDRIFASFAANHTRTYDELHRTQEFRDQLATVGAV